MMLRLAGAYLVMDAAASLGRFRGQVWWMQVIRLGRLAIGLAMLFDGF